MSVADMIAGNLLDRSVDLARLEAGERRKVLAILRDMEQAIVAQLKRIDPTAPRLTRYRQARLEKLLDEVRAVTRRTYSQILRQQEAVLGGVALEEGAAAAQAINASVGVDLMAAGLSTARLTALADDLLVLGAPAQEHWARQAATIQLKFQDTMRRSLLVGNQLAEMIQQTKQLVRVHERASESLVRTSLQSVQNATRGSIFDANADVIDGIQIISTLDTRVCPICQALSGKSYTTDKQPIGHNKLWPGYPPFHMNCRCTTIAIPKSFDELREIRGIQLQRQLDELAAGQRSEIDGELAIDLSFPQWLTTKPASTQRQILGPGRYRLWKAGKIRIDQLTDQSHRILTLDALEDLAS